MENMLSEAVGKLKRRGEGETEEEKRILLSELCPSPCPPPKIHILKLQSQGIWRWGL